MVRFEDFVMNQEDTLARLEQFLGFPLARIGVARDAVGRWQQDPGTNYYAFLEPVRETATKSRQPLQLNPS
jgi:hypothetical protein